MYPHLMAAMLPVLVLAYAAQAAPLTQCQNVVIAGHDTTYGNGGQYTGDGKAEGQVFYAQDTVITKITVWRPGYNINLIGTHLYVIGVDTTRTPFKPVSQNMLRDGPSVFVHGGGTSLIEMPYVLDPPLDLPGPGYYAFFLQPDGCDQGVSHIIRADWSNRYPYGSFYASERVGYNGSCFLPRIIYNDPTVDLIFQIEYCIDAATATRRSTWGRVKTLYR